MQFFDEELLLQSRGRRVSPGTKARLAEKRLAQARVRRELAQLAGREEQPRERLRAAVSQAGTAITAALATAHHSGSTGER